MLNALPNTAETLNNNGNFDKTRSAKFLPQLFAGALLACTGTSVLAISAGDDPFPIPDIPEESFSPTSPIPYLSRDVSQIALKFGDSSNEEDGYHIQRRIGDSQSWSTIYSMGPLNGGGFVYLDAGLQSDTKHCYRVQAYNQNGSYSPQGRCVYTKDGNSNPIWRAQLKIRTSRANGAGTDDDVYVALNDSSPVYQPYGNRTWIDYGRDDFEQGDEFTYDLNMERIGEIGDINQITIGKLGSNGWCIAEVQLIVNNVDMFQKSFSSESDGCQWIGGGSGTASAVTIGITELRNHTFWSQYNPTSAGVIFLNNGIPENELESRIESIVGENIRLEELYWGQIQGRAVEVSNGCASNVDPVDCDKAHVNLDLAANASINGIPLPDPEVNIDFDLQFTCTDNGLTIETINFQSNVETAFFWEFFSLGILEAMDNNIESRIRSGWKHLTTSLGGFAGCEVFVNNGKVTLSLPSETSPDFNPNSSTDSEL